MHRRLKLTALSLLVLLLCACGRVQYHAQTAPRELAQDRLSSLKAVGPVALKNASSKTPGVEEILCQFGAWDVMGSLYDFTNTALAMTKNALQKSRVQIDENAKKTLELTIFKASCEKGWVFFTRASLRVRTENGLVKEYHGEDSFGTGYQTTAGFEMAMKRCVEQMLSDREIVGFLEK